MRIAKRYDLEAVGIMVSGITIAIDRISWAQLTGTYASLKNGVITSAPRKDV